MQDKTKVANFTLTLEPRRRITYSTTAIFRAPTQCQHIAVYGRAPYLAGRRQLQGRARKKSWWLALPRLRHGWCRLESRHDS